MEALYKIRKGIDAVLGVACIILFALMVIVGSYQIITRFVFNNPSTVSEELLTYTFAWLAMLSTAYVFGKREHMRMGFLADKMAGNSKKVLEIAIECLVVVFAATVLIYGGFTIMGLTMTQKTASLGVMMGVIYTVVPISGILIVFYGILNIINLLKNNLSEQKEEA